MDWTKSGLLLLLIGIIVSVIPLIGAIGGLLIIVGAILVILGRKAFGERHSRFILISVVVWIVGVAATAIFFLLFFFSILIALQGTPSSSVNAQLVSTLTEFLPGVVIVSAITSLSYVLFTYAIQDQTGRILLWTAYGLALVVQIVVLILILPTISTLVYSSSSSTLNPGQFLNREIQLYSVGVLNFIPFAFYAIAYYLLWSRINRGEIPTKPSPQPPMPPLSPTAM